MFLSISLTPYTLYTANRILQFRVADEHGAVAVPVRGCALQQWNVAQALIAVFAADTAVRVRPVQILCCVGLGGCEGEERAVGNGGDLPRDALGVSACGEVHNEHLAARFTRRLGVLRPASGGETEQEQDAEEKSGQFLHKNGAFL